MANPTVPLILVGDFNAYEFTDGTGTTHTGSTASSITKYGQRTIKRTLLADGTATDEAGRTVAQSVVDAAARHNAAGPASIGVVVGATRDHGLDLGAVGGPILAPGLGAQGATAADLAVVFDGVTRLLVPSASRQVLAAGPDTDAVADAAEALRDEVEAALR